MEHNLIRDIALCIGAAWLLGVAAQLARQPVILAYLLGGFLLGPTTFKIVTDHSSIDTISELGLIFLLFMIGLEIDLKKIISAGKSITYTALSQIVGGAALGVLFFRLVGFGLGIKGVGGWDALYLGLGAALSSTVIIVKVLYDKRELDTLPGRITLGILVLQDLAAILFLAIQPNLNSLQAVTVLLSLLRVFVLVSSAMLVSKYLLPGIFHRVARLPELVLVGAIGWCFLVSQFAEMLDLSREMGALVAGVALSTFPYALDVTAKVTSLRDFFVTLFFVSLGMKISPPSGSVVGWALVFGAFTVVTRFATTFPPLYRLGQGFRTSLLPALNLAQVSEFSLVLLEIGADPKFGHVSPAAKDMVSITFVLLAAGSTLAMGKSDRWVRAIIPTLRRLGLRDLDAAGETHAHGDGHGRSSRILLLGFFRSASALVAEMEQRAPDLLAITGVVDFNPEVHRGLKARGINVLYGDISQRDTLVHAGVGNAEVLVCSVPDSLLKGITNEKLVQQLRELNPQATIIAPAELLDDAEKLIRAGANQVVVPRISDGTELLAALQAWQQGTLVQARETLLSQLKTRREILS